MKSRTRHGKCQRDAAEILVGGAGNLCRPPANDHAATPKPDGAGDTRAQLLLLGLWERPELRLETKLSTPWRP